MQLIGRRDDPDGHVAALGVAPHVVGYVDATDQLRLVEMGPRSVAPNRQWGQVVNSGITGLLILTMFFQRQFLQGVMSGAPKG